MADGRPKFLPTFIILVLHLTAQCNGAQQYLGKFLGKLSELHHGVSGEVYAVDARTLHLKDFTYDGEGPAAYFWAGSTRSPGSAGFRVRDENGSGAVLKRYRKQSVTLTLPDGKNLNNIKWFSVWCEEYAVNFGDVKIPRNFDYPKPQKIEALRGVHGISSDNIVIVDAQTLLVPNLSYDGEAPDAKFWVGRGSKPSPQGIRVPDENGKEVPLRRYDRKTVVLTLPGDLTVFDIGHFGIWCEAFTVDFGHVRIPQPLNVPPSLKMLGVSPQKRARALPFVGESNSNALQPFPSALVGGQLEATTFRPSVTFIHQQHQQQQQQQYQQPYQQVYIAQHRQDNPSVLQNQQLQQQQFVQQPQYYQVIQQQPLQYYNPQLLQQQQQLLNQQFAQQRIDQNLYTQQHQQQPIYNQVNNRQILNEQLAYNQLVNQRRLLEEQQLRERLNKSYNRFDLSSHSAATFG